MTSGGDVHYAAARRRPRHSTEGRRGSTGAAGRGQWHGASDSPVAVGYFDGDDVLDVVLGSQRSILGSDGAVATTHTLLFWRGLGDGTFERRAPLVVGEQGPAHASYAPYGSPDLRTPLAVVSTQGRRDHILVVGPAHHRRGDTVAVLRNRGGWSFEPDEAEAGVLGELLSGFSITSLRLALIDSDDVVDLLLLLKPSHLSPSTQTQNRAANPPPMAHVHMHTHIHKHRNFKTNL